MVGVVGLHVGWTRRQVVAAHVGCDDAKARVREWLDLQSPAEPELREAVQQNDQRPFTHLDVMQAHIADVGRALTKLCPVQVHVCETSRAVGSCQLPRATNRRAAQRSRSGAAHSARRRNSDRCSRIAYFNRARGATSILLGDRSIDAPFAYRPSGGELPISAAVWGASQDAWVR